ncbi:protein LURP-one-related 14-like [Salvia miltiorrhiza]|uniref:protein LURP-one-related 14-like n=1 Tax=Salvia miltiorrhiza TaxID=226208 RepID=UPI0025ABFB05|nr:protein LURP-one-related 14-like [Salvia miltiorrhiza]
MFVPEGGRLVPTVSIVKDDYCYPYLVELGVSKSVGLSSKHICAFDGTGTLLLQVIGGFWQFNKKRTMYNSFGHPIITMRRKAHQEWIVHSGERVEGSNLLYSVKKAESFQLKTKLEIFLSTNTNTHLCDFRVIGSYTSQSFKVYKGETVVAEVKEKSKLRRLGTGSFQARIYPGIDYAFIVSLLVIFTEIDF